MTERFYYLTDEEEKMEVKHALLQIAIGLQTCKTKGDVVELLMDAVTLGRRQVAHEKDEQFKTKLKELIDWLDDNRTNNTIWRLTEDAYNDFVMEKVESIIKELEAGKK